MKTHWWRQSWHHESSLGLVITDTLKRWHWSWRWSWRSWHYVLSQSIITVTTNDKGINGFIKLLKSPSPSTWLGDNCAIWPILCPCTLNPNLLTYFPLRHIVSWKSVIWCASYWATVTIMKMTSSYYLFKIMYLKILFANCQIDTSTWN